MKNKKGFTLIEVLAVIVLLGILVSVATVGVSKYRKDVDEKERYSIRQTIKAAFTNYRIMNDVSPEEHKGEDALGNEEEIMKLLKFDGGNTLKYGGDKCEISTDSKVLYLINGDYYNDLRFTDDEKVKYKVCEIDGSGESCAGTCKGDIKLLDTEDKCIVAKGTFIETCSDNNFSNQGECESNGKEWIKKCNGANLKNKKICQNIKEQVAASFEWELISNASSNMETICIKLSCNGNVIIDDFNDGDSLCNKVKGDLGIS